jgi:hypothetical protein
MRVEGQCHCGAIRYEAEVEHGSMRLCHCLDCQTLTGAPFRASIQAPSETFRLLAGEPRKYIKTADSGAKRVHAFCSECGAPVFACAPVDPPSYSLRVGALKQRAELGHPAGQIWTKRRLPWVPPLDGVPESTGQP